MKSRLIALMLPMVLVVAVAVAAAEDAGQIKVSKGSAQIERSGQKLPASVGHVVQQGDVVITGSDGSVGITFRDNSLVSIGPDSVLAIDRFVFNSTTHQGNFDSTLKQGTLPGQLRQHAEAGDPGRRFRQAGQAIARGDEGQDAGGDSRCARDRVPCSHGPGERLIPCPPGRNTSSGWRRSR